MDREGLIFNIDFCQTVFGFEPEKRDSILASFVEISWVRLSKDKEEWSTPLNGMDIEALDRNHYVLSLIDEFPETIKGELRDHFARALRAGVSFEQRPYSPSESVDYIHELMKPIEGISNN